MINKAVITSKQAALSKKNKKYKSVQKGAIYPIWHYSSQIRR